MKEVLTDFKALADETRLRIVNLLADGERCVCEIVAALAQEQPRVSFHLRILKEAGIIVDRRQERWIHYRLNEADPFIRSLLPVIHERADQQQKTEDLRRLADFNKDRKGQRPGQVDGDPPGIGRS